MTFIYVFSDLRGSLVANLDASFNAMVTWSLLDTIYQWMMTLISAYNSTLRRENKVISHGQGLWNVISTLESTLNSKSCGRARPANLHPANTTVLLT